MLKVCCDICDRPLPVEIIEDMKCVQTYRTKEWDTRKLFPNLCKSCASKLDMAFDDLKNGMIKREQLLIKFKKANEERRQRLGTEG
jgi:hypothetical protein